MSFRLREDTPNWLCEKAPAYSTWGISTQAKYLKSARRAARWILRSPGCIRWELTTKATQ